MALNVGTHHDQDDNKGTTPGVQALRLSAPHPHPSIPRALGNFQFKPLKSLLNKEHIEL